MLRTVSIQVPDSLLSYGVDKQDIENHVSEWLALKLFTEGEISSGKAASLLGISYLEFVLLLKAQGIPYPDYTPEDLEAEFAAVEFLQSTHQ